MHVAELAVGIFALVALLMAKRPDVFAELFLAKWQRDRLASNMNELSWTGWIIFTAAAIVCVVLLIADVVRR
jgi:hypothetical protein